MISRVKGSMFPRVCYNYRHHLSHVRAHVQTQRKEGYNLFYSVLYILLHILLVSSLVIVHNDLFGLCQERMICHCSIFTQCKNIAMLYK